jgi:pimeloyl-ACP methyl ester carboxylesterase
VPALAYAGEHPEQIQSLLLLSMGAPTRVRDDRAFGPAFAARKSKLRQSNLLVSKPSGDGCLASFNASLPAHFADPRHPAARAGLPGSYACDIGRMMVESASDWDFRAVITRFERPILLLVGDADANLVGTRDTAGFADRADVTSVILPECGHFPWLECPEPFYRATTRFLEQSAR